MAHPASPRLSSTLALVAQALEASPLPAVILDGEGVILHLSSVAARMVPDGAVAPPRRLSDLLGPETPKALVAGLDLDAFASGAEETLVQERIGVQTFRMSVRALDIPGEGRFLVAVLHQGGDLSGPSRGAQQLREDAMQALIDAYSDAILLFDAELRCVQSNPLAHEATGYSAEALARISLVDLGIVKDAEEAGALLGQASQGQGAGTRCILATGRGEKLPLRAQINLLLGSSTRAVGLCSFPPPRVTSGRLAAVRQSGTFGRPVGSQGVSFGSAGSAGSPAAKVGVGRATDTPGRPTEAAKGGGTKPYPGPGRPAVAALGVGKPSVAPQPGASPPAAPGAPLVKVSPDLTEPSGPPEHLETLVVEKGAGGGETFEGEATTTELAMEDLQEEAAPPPTPESAKQALPPPVPAPTVSRGSSASGAPAAPAAPGRGISTASASKSSPLRTGMAGCEVLVQITASPSRVISVVGELEALLGYSPSEVLEWTAEAWLERMHEPALATQLSQMWNGLVGQKFAPGALPEQTMEYALVRKDGGVVPCRTIWRAIQSADGTFEGLELVIQPG